MAPNAGDSARKGQNMDTDFKHVYGPVPSRRLGRSLGVDALTFKSCSFDCVYCQLGRTTNHTIERKEYIPTADILDEVRRKLENGDKPEYISFAGSGEPHAALRARRHHPGHQGHDRCSGGGVHQRLPAVDAGSPRRPRRRRCGDPLVGRRRRRVARQGEPPRRVP